MQNKIEIQAIRSRPRFVVKSTLSVDEFITILRLHFKNHNKIFGGYINKSLSVIRLRKSKDQLWAPQLQIRVEVDEDNPELIEIRGVFGPKPSVWTLIMFSYGLGVAIIITTGIYGWVELFLGIGSFWVWTNLLGVFILLGTYTASKVGQSIAKEHMNALRLFIETVLVKERLLN